MNKIKIKFKNLIYRVSFLFRPITPVTVSFIFLMIASALLAFIILNLDENTKSYQVLLAILTGITTSLLISIMMELYNNYRFNVKRQRELRKYFRIIASYEINVESIIKTNNKYASELGSGRVCAVFCHLNTIIPCLREVLNNRDYLYQAEVEEIDNILYEYNDVVKIIWIGLLDVFMGLIDDESVDATLTEHPTLMKFLKKEAKRHVRINKGEGDTLYDEAPDSLKNIIEKAIFFNMLSLMDILK